MKNAAVSLENKKRAKAKAEQGGLASLPLTLTSRQQPTLPTLQQLKALRPGPGLFDEILPVSTGHVSYLSNADT